MKQHTEVSVYREHGNGTNPEAHYRLVDPQLFFSNTGLQLFQAFALQSQQLELTQN
jgi:hypothetical protein